MAASGLCLATGVGVRSVTARVSGPRPNLTDSVLHSSSNARRLFVGWLVVGLIGAAFVGHDMTKPGSFDDELVGVYPALQFLDPELSRIKIKEASTVRLFGRDFPFMTQSYMGALKSQLLIPVFAVLEPTITTLRRTTLVWSWLGIGLMMAWAAGALGPCVALVAGVLVVLDPSFLWVSRHDWGSFALGFLLRCGALYFLLDGWTRKRNGRLFLGGLCVGLGLFNKVDFVVFPFAAGLGLLLVAPYLVRQALGQRRTSVALAALGFFGSVIPLLLVAADAQHAARHAFATADINPVTVGEKLVTLATTLDGSRFDSLMRAGGKARYIPELDPATGPFLVIFLAASLWLGFRLVRGRREGVPWRAEAFLLLTASLTVIGILIIPRTERLHHALNLYPFPHLIVAAVVARLWLGDGGGKLSRRAARGAAGALVTLVVLGSVYVHWQTWTTIHRSGGKGLWSDVRMRHTAELLEERPVPTAVVLDWGFAWGLRYERPALPMIDLPAEMRRRGDLAWSFDGTPQFDYLLYPDRYATFPYGARFLKAARRLPPELVSVRDHYDGQGDLAFRSVRIRRPHRVKLGRGVEIELRESLSR